MVVLKKRLGPSLKVRTPLKTPTGCRLKSRDECYVRVAIRVRPENEKERNPIYKSVIKCDGATMLQFDPKETEDEFYFRNMKQQYRDINKREPKNKTYIFDNVFGPEASNEQVYLGTAHDAVETVVKGYNCSVFAYGATGSGKTFTMLGNNDTKGLIYLTVSDLFKKIHEMNEHHFEIEASYIEVYNEELRDLLQKPSPKLAIQELGNRVVVKGASVHKPKTPEEFLELLRKGNSQRTQHPTDSNSESSRSHAIFQLTVKCRPKGPAVVSQWKVAKLSLIDLAGSEKGSATGFNGARFREGVNINKSLLALGNVITSLAEGNKHIPFRDSNLTRLLKDSIGGNCKTVLIATVSPSSLSMEETQKTFNFAERASRIKSRLQQNVKSVEVQVAEYRRIIDDLKAKLDGETNKRIKAEERANELEAKITKNDFTLLHKLDPSTSTVNEGRFSKAQSSGLEPSAQAARAACETVGVASDPTAHQMMICEAELKKLQDLVNSHDSPYVKGAIDALKQCTSQVNAEKKAPATTARSLDFIAKGSDTQLENRRKKKMQLFTCDKEILNLQELIYCLDKKIEYINTLNPLPDKETTTRYTTELEGCKKSLKKKLERKQSLIKDLESMSTPTETTLDDDYNISRFVILELMQLLANEKRDKWDYVEQMGRLTKVTRNHYFLLKGLNGMTAGIDQQYQLAVKRFSQKNVNWGDEKAENNLDKLGGFFTDIEPLLFKNAQSLSLGDTRLNGLKQFYSPSEVAINAQKYKSSTEIVNRVDRPQKSSSLSGASTNGLAGELSTEIVNQPHKSSCLSEASTNGLAGELSTEIVNQPQKSSCLSTNGLACELSTRVEGVTKIADVDEKFSLPSEVTTSDKTSKSPSTGVSQTLKNLESDVEKMSMNEPFASTPSVRRINIQERVVQFEDQTLSPIVQHPLPCDAQKEVFISEIPLPWDFSQEKSHDDLQPTMHELECIKEISFPESLAESVQTPDENVPLDLTIGNSCRCSINDLTTSKPNNSTFVEMPKDATVCGLPVNDENSFEVLKPKRQPCVPVQCLGAGCLNTTFNRDVSLPTSGKPVAEPRVSTPNNSKNGFSIRSQGNKMCNATFSPQGKPYSSKIRVANRGRNSLLPMASRRHSLVPSGALPAVRIRAPSSPGIFPHNSGAQPQFLPRRGNIIPFSNARKTWR